ncbi:Predicted arabinose efflux permease, MFS family [Geodermatophilus siccatus]|uniref:Predicted arabinose efflux permease, MFS family n=2 Tax=Geodermatophilus siccatus TaxID=1137991 RepID=A0A1G9Y957_9ACTN|nr:Predicted arabinose efflux permease, MFS family [Geodermatophilus siccatus]
MAGRSVDAAAPARAVGAPERGRGTATPVAVLGIGAFATGTDLFVVAGVLPGLADDLGLTVGTAGLTGTVSAAAYAVGGPVLGAALGARPRRRVLIGSLASFGACTAIAAAAPTFAVLLVARVLGALAASVHVPVAAAAAVAAVPARSRGRALGVVLGGASAAMVLGAPLGVLLAGLLSWRAAFGLAAVFAAGGVVVLLCGDVGSGRLPPSTLSERLRPVRRPAVVVTLGATVLVMAGSNGVYSYLGVLLDPVAGPAGPGLVMAAFGLGGAAGARWGGILADRLGDRRLVLLAGGALTAAVAALPLVASTGGALLVVVAGWGTAAWAFTAAQQHRVLRLGGDAASVSLALNSAATHVGFAVGALLGGLVVDTAGPGPLALLGVALGSAGLILHRSLDLEVRS